MTDANRQQGRDLFMNAMEPLRTAQTEGYRQGLLRAAELARMAPDASGLTVATLIERHADQLPKPPVAE